VTTFHGYYSVNQYSAVMTKGERVVAISKGIATHMTRQYGIDPERIALIYRGVDHRIFDPSAVTRGRMEHLRNRWGLDPSGPPVILLPGRLTQWKGHEVFVEALTRIRDLPWVALCVGDTEENQNFTGHLRSMIHQNRLKDRVRLVGHCDDMPAAFRVAQVVVSASAAEPEAFGRIAVEAQAMGRPVIASAHGGSLETVVNGQTGWLVTPGDAGARALALTEAVQKGDLRETFGQNGRKWVTAHFTVEQMCRSTLKLYHGMLARDGGG
jgi:glycosyltransferase involved in cell wall biosynthesis